MPDVSWLTKRSFRKLPRDYHLRGAEKTKSSLAAAWQLLVSDSSKQAGPTPGAGGHSVASQERERGTYGSGTWGKPHNTEPTLIKEVGTSFFLHCENAWHLLLSFTPVLL